LALVVSDIAPANTNESIKFLRNFMKFPPFISLNCRITT